MDLAKRLNFDFEYKQKDAKTGELFIEGWANRAMKDGAKVIDRGKEHIPGSEWSVEEWKKNPIIFFNHNRDMPIGKGVAVKVSDEGLWIKAKISKSDVPEIKKVRDLIEEKILKTFSVGIDVDSEEDVEGVLHLKGVNLLETSVVSLPMNQESDFETSTKMMKEEPKEKIAEKICNFKGAYVAGAIHNAIYENMNNEDFSREEALNKISQQADISLEQLFEILAGNTIAVTEEQIQAFSSVLGMDGAKLSELNDADIAQSKDGMIRPEEEDTENPTDEDGNPESNDEDPMINTENPDGNPNENTEEPNEEEDPNPNPEGEDLEDTDGEELEDSTEEKPTEDKPTEEELEDPESEPLDDEEKACGKKPHEDEKQNVNTENFGSCVSNQIRKEIEAGKELDQAIASALQKCRKDDGKCDLTPQDWKMIWKDIDSIKQVGDGITVPFGTINPNIDLNPGNAELQELRQLNIGIAQMIGELQKLAAILTGNITPVIPTNPVEQAIVDLSLSADECDKLKAIDIFDKYKQKLKERFKEVNL